MTQQMTGQRTYVVYHAGCLDGFGAAWAAHLSLGDNNVEYLPASYGNPPPNFRTESRIFILDFSYPREITLELIGQHQRQIFTKDRFKVFLTYRGHVFDRNGEPCADTLWRDARNGERRGRRVGPSALILSRRRQ